MCLDVVTWGSVGVVPLDRPGPPGGSGGPRRACELRGGSCPPSGPAARGAAYEPLEGQRALFLAGRARARALVVAARLSRVRGAGRPARCAVGSGPGRSRVWCRSQAAPGLVSGSRRRGGNLLGVGRAPGTRARARGGRSLGLGPGSLACALGARERHKLVERETANREADHDLDPPRSEHAILAPASTPYPAAASATDPTPDPRSH